MLGRDAHQSALLAMRRLAGARFCYAGILDGSGAREVGVGRVHSGHNGAQKGGSLVKGCMSVIKPEKAIGCAPRH